MDKVRIKLQDISKSYYSETAVTQALRKVSLTFYSREFVAITGESGSGKSTLLNVIGGMDAFDDGEMYVDGEPTFQYDDADWEDYRRNKIGYVFQDYSLVGHYTALDNVLSALLIMDSDMERAKKIAIDYLGQVGLSGYENQRASELSSGQKQRLSIARALAKNTGIIVADEPTGNLDSETGEQIIKLLKELSKERLVIMVTHNYSQVEPYVTRKIRIHEGVVISDTSINAEDSDIKDEDGVHNESLSDNDNQTREEACANISKSNIKSYNIKIAAFFARRNQFTQLGRSFLFTIFLMVVSVVSFLFVGEIFSHADDTLTKEYSNNAFYHKDEKRLVVGRKDGKEITDDDVDKIAGVRNVVSVDKYDIVNDINYYIIKDRDYKFLYGNAAKRSTYSTSGSNEVMTVKFLNTDHFMMSAGGICDGDLKSGRLPEARNEIVMYSDDDSVLDTEIDCYFTALNYWDADQYYISKFKIVGLLKENTEQVYFSEALCDMFTAYSNADEFRLCSTFKKDWGDRTKKYLALLLINDELKDDEIKVSSKYDTKPAGKMVAYLQKYDEDGNELGEPIEKAVTVVETNTKSTDLFMEVSENTFKEFYELNSYQASVYMTSYAMTDSVIKKLDKMGYKAVSTYRLSSTGYVEELVNERILLLAISVFGLIAIMFAEVLILRSLMKIRIKDYFVLKFIGMRMQTIRRIGYYEIMGYGFAALIITIIVMWVLRIAGVGFIQDIMWYYSLPAYTAFVIYNVLLWFLTVMSFNRILKGRLNS